MCTTIRHFTDLLLEDLGQLVELHQRKPRTLSQYFGTAHHYFCLPVRGTQTLFECDVTTIAVAEVREWHRACALKARSSGTPGHSSPSVTLNIYGRRLATPGARASAERHGLRMRRAA